MQLHMQHLINVWKVCHAFQFAILVVRPFYVALPECLVTQACWYNVWFNLWHNKFLLRFFLVFHVKNDVLALVTDTCFVEGEYFVTYLVQVYLIGSLLNSSCCLSRIFSSLYPWHPLLLAGDVTVHLLVCTVY